MLRLRVGLYGRPGQGEGPFLLSPCPCVTSQLSETWTVLTYREEELTMIHQKTFQMIQ
jgi:hypothetical protein